MSVADVFPPQAPPPADAPPPTSTGPSRRRRLYVLIGVVAALLAALATLTVWYAHTRKPLSQLPGLSKGEKGPHYLFSMYGVTRPVGVAVSVDGDRVYVAESDGPRLVHVYDRDGTQVGTLKPPGDGGAAHVPVYVAVSPLTGEVYVSDRMTSSVYVYDRTGEYRLTYAPEGVDTSTWAPLGLGFTPDGGLVVTDVRAEGGHRVLVFSPEGRLVRELGSGLGLSFPNGVAVDRHGVLAVSDSNNARVLLFGPDGATAGRIVGTSSGQVLGLPRGLAADADGRLYVVDASAQSVDVYRTPDKAAASSPAALPAYVFAFGTEGTGDAAFEYPNAVAVDARARLYVTDRENNRLQVWGY